MELGLVGGVRHLERRLRSISTHGWSMRGAAVWVLHEEEEEKEEGNLEKKGQLPHTAPIWRSKTRWIVSWKR